MWKDKFIISSFFASFVLFFTAVFFSFSNFFNLDPETSLILRFNSGHGIANFGGFPSLLIFCFSSFFISLLNLFLARVFYNRLRLFSLFLGFLSFFVSVLILVEVGVIISVN
ncbi:MAG: hypothetical protein PHZ25_00965 [Candidatus Pacebacteria bacterium]|nr:hypothetical protein [Candidatus Paceibacterota bacterium]